MRPSASGVILNYNDFIDKNLEMSEQIKKLVKINQAMIDDIFMLVELGKKLERQVDKLESDVLKLRGML